MVDRIVLLTLIAALATWGLARPRRPPVIPPLVSLQHVQPWMVNALPGVGPKHQAAALQAVATQRFDDLPKPARAVARQVFAQP